MDWQIDNSAFQLSFAKHRSRAERLNDIIRDIIYLQLQFGFILNTSWIATEDNILPDDLSRSADSGHGEAAFLAASGALLPGVTLQRHPQAGRVVTFADHAHLARELREGASEGRWAAQAAMGEPAADPMRPVNASLTVAGDVPQVGGARPRGPTPASFLPYVSSFEH